MALVEAALEWLSERTSVTPTDWAVGIEARVRALRDEGDDAERWYRESIECFGRTEIRAQSNLAVNCTPRWRNPVRGTSQPSPYAMAAASPGRSFAA